MTDLSDVNMDGVKAMSDAEQLGVGKYLVRIEDSDKIATKEKFDENGDKMPGGHYLQFALKVYGGPNDGQTEFSRLNLWNANAVAVNLAKSELKSIQDATGIASPKSDDYHGKWLLLEVKPGVKDPQKTHKRYSAAPAELIEMYKDLPPIPAKPQTTHSATASVGSRPNVATAAGSSGVMASATTGKATPSWAAKKTS